jgi:predicted esterase
MKTEISEHHMRVQKTVRYYIVEPQGEWCATLFAIHGYRQLGKYFARNFTFLAEAGIKVIVPEGLHRFYIQGYDGRVGASWMTKEDRLSDIHDYVDYLNALFDQIDTSGLPIHLLGFSQGGPTACRWLASSDISFSSLILHSTVFPNDFDFQGQRERFSSMPSYTIFGDDDPFASEEVIRNKMVWMNEKGVSPRLLRFHGGHSIDAASLHLIFNELLTTDKHP